MPPAKLSQMIHARAIDPIGYRTYEGVERNERVPMTREMQACACDACVAPGERGVACGGRDEQGGEAELHGIVGDGPAAQFVARRPAPDGKDVVEDVGALATASQERQKGGGAGAPGPHQPERHECAGGHAIACGDGWRDARERPGDRRRVRHGERRVRDQLRRGCRSRQLLGGAAHGESVQLDGGQRVGARSEEEGEQVGEVGHAIVDR